MPKNWPGLYKGQRLQGQMHQNYVDFWSNLLISFMNILIWRIFVKNWSGLCKGQRPQGKIYQITYLVFQNWWILLENVCLQRERAKIHGAVWKIKYFSIKILREINFSELKTPKITVFDNFTGCKAYKLVTGQCLKS